MENSGDHGQWHNFVYWLGKTFGGSWKECVSSRKQRISGKRLESYPKGISGLMGMLGYNQVQKVTHCGCWAHARRKWREAMPCGATVKTSEAAVGFQYCTKLLSLEKKYLYADIKAYKDYRQNVSRPLLEE